MKNCPNITYHKKLADTTARDIKAIVKLGRGLTHWVLMVAPRLDICPESQARHLDCPVDGL